LFSETTGPIGTKLGMNVICTFLSKVTFLLLMEYTRERRGPKVSKREFTVFVCGEFIF
jgi:hypothetical protein